MKKNYNNHIDSILFSRKKFFFLPRRVTFGDFKFILYLCFPNNGQMTSLEYRFMMNRLGRRLYHCLMFYAR